MDHDAILTHSSLFKISDSQNQRQLKKLMEIKRLAIKKQLIMNSNTFCI